MCAFEEGNAVRKMEALWAYQEAEVAKNTVENEIRTTPARLQLNKLHKQLKNQQAVIAKLSEDIEAYELQLTKLNDQVSKLESRLQVESSELVTIKQDDESTAEEMTELKVDIERLNREVSQGVREAKSLLGEIEKASEEYQNTARAASKARYGELAAKGMAEAVGDVAPATVREWFKRYGVRRMIHGHTHRPAIHDEGHGNTRIVLGDWYEQGSVLRVGEDGVELASL